MVTCHRNSDQVVVTAVFAPRTSKTVGEDATLQVLAEIPLHVAGQSRSGRIVGQAEEALQVAPPQAGLFH